MIIFGIIKYCLFVCKSLFLYRNKINLLINKKKHLINNVTSINVNMLKRYNIKYLIFDFDGVLVFHDSNYLNYSIKIWLIKLIQDFHQIGITNNIFILSNNLNIDREKYFRLYFPSIKFIKKVRKKPYPDGIIKIGHHFNCSLSSIALIDDRIMTGFLASIIAGAFPILVINPLKNYRTNFFKEIFFSFLRFLERKIFK